MKNNIKVFNIIVKLEIFFKFTTIGTLNRFYKMSDSKALLFTLIMKILILVRFHKI